VSRGHPIEPGYETPFQKRIIIEIDGSTSVPTLTDGDTTTATTIADPSHTGELSIATIHADASGDDRENLNDEYIVFENSGEEAIDFPGGPFRMKRITTIHSLMASHSDRARKSHSTREVGPIQRPTCTGNTTYVYYKTMRIYSNVGWGIGYYK
jgi:hypothetical protein